MLCKTCCESAYPKARQTCARLTVHQPEHVVQDIVAAVSSRHELEDLGEVHRSLLIIDLSVALAMFMSTMSSTYCSMMPHVQEVRQ
jgi:hypothetical protein